MYRHQTHIWRIGVDSLPSKYIIWSTYIIRIRSQSFKNLPVYSLRYLILITDRGVTQRSRWEERSLKVYIKVILGDSIAIMSSKIHYIVTFHTLWRVVHLFTGNAMWSSLTPIDCCRHSILLESCKTAQAGIQHIFFLIAAFPCSYWVYNDEFL